MKQFIHTNEKEKFSRIGLGFHWHLFVCLFSNFLPLLHLGLDSFPSHLSGSHVSQKESHVFHGLTGIFSFHFQTYCLVGIQEQSIVYSSRGIDHLTKGESFGFRQSLGKSPVEDNNGEAFLGGLDSGTDQQIPRMWIPIKDGGAIHKVCKGLCYSINDGSP